MPNVFDANGLLVMTRAELVAYYTDQYFAIYGTDVNLDPDTQDGQWINVQVQAVLDLQDLLVSINSSFDPDNAVGVTLDQRCAINGVEREGGTFTTTPVTLVTSQTLNLYGLDQTVQPVYTVADAAGNQWQLQITVIGVTVGTHVYEFQAANAGAVLTVPNTITTPVTVVLGVTSINNPSTYSSLGVNEESDALLKVRRQQSVANGSQGYLAGLIGALRNIPGVSYADVFENLTGVTDGNGIPGHTTWAIVAGSGTAAAIANAIYTKRNAGAGMKGGINFSVTQIDGTTFVVSWDNVQSQNLFIAFTVTSINGTAVPNIAAIRAGLVTGLTPGVNAEVNINEVATAVQVIDPNTLVTNAGLSLGTTQTLTLSGIAASGAFKVFYNGVLSASIAWNDSIGTIQTKVQAITGLLLATVTGSIASQSLVFNLTLVTNGVQGLVSVSANTLQTVAPAAITFAFNEGYANILTPTLLKDQFAVTAPNIIILPMQLSPATAVIPHGDMGTFTGLGGYGPYVYSISVNNSSGSIDASTGVYTAGSTPNVADTLLVTDVFGNTATAIVSVT